MTKLRLCSDLDAVAQGFDSPECRRRRQVLRETLSALEACQPADHYQRLAAANLAGWQRASQPPAAALQQLVLAGDWGDVTGRLTRRFGTCFAVLNMANAYFPGGAYGQGAVAQEENMFRRTDCHFQVQAEELDDSGCMYTPEMTRLLSGSDGRVYLDTARPRVCIRGAEDRSAPDLGYAWLAPDEVFPFFELRAAAQDLRDGSVFDGADARQRIAAQLDTLRQQGVRHAVLGAFGCGAFRNPATEVARLYREEIAARSTDFDVIGFAIFAPGYGPDNFAAFDEVFRTAG